MKLSRIGSRLLCANVINLGRTKFWASNALRQILLGTARARAWNSVKFEVVDRPSGLEPILDVVLCTSVFGVMIEGEHFENAEEVIVVFTILTERRGIVDCRRCIDESYVLIKSPRSATKISNVAPKGCSPIAGMQLPRHGF